MKRKNFDEIYREVLIRFGTNWRERRLLNNANETIGDTYLNSEPYEPNIGESFGYNINGNLYFYDERENIHWATAEVLEKPEKWVVEKDEEHPMWEKFKTYVWSLEGRENTRFVFQFYSQDKGEDILTRFHNHQYLTLDQWAELFLPKYKVGDKVITEGYSNKYDGKVLTINKIDSSGYYYFDEANNKSHNFEIEHIKHLVTSEKLNEILEKYPELVSVIAPPKEGDWCLFWDKHIEEGAIRKYRSKSDIGGYNHIDDAGCYWTYCKKINSTISMGLNSEIEKIKSMQNA